MRKTIKIPRILKINWIKGLTISVVFNNGESRIIDFEDVFNRFHVDKHSPEFILYDAQEFAKVEILGTTLSWCNVEQWITLMNGKKGKVPYEIGPDTLYDLSKPDNSKVDFNLGHAIKKTRIKSGMTQKELAMKSGTTRNYISRLENNRSDIELGTLRKIIEVGLGKRMDIRIK